MALPESLPCVRGGGVQSPLSPRLPCARGGGVQSPLPPRLPCVRGRWCAVASSSAPPLCKGGGGVQSPLPPRLPCVRGGAAQRRWGCKPCLISRYRANPSGLQPLSRPSGRQLPLHRGAFSCCLPSKQTRKQCLTAKSKLSTFSAHLVEKTSLFPFRPQHVGEQGGMRDGKILSILRLTKNGRRAKKTVIMEFLHKKVLTRRGFILYNQSLQGCPQEPGIAESDFYH